MNQVKVKRDDLLAVVKTNRERHIAEYEQSVVGYKREAIDEIERAMAAMKRQVSELREGEVVRLGAVCFNLVVPENHSGDYDRVIKMLEMCVDEQLEVNEREFSKYAMDVWDWTEDFRNTTSHYNRAR